MDERERRDRREMTWPEVEREARALCERLAMGGRQHVADMVMDLVERAHECGREER